jgi:hypothetical protein
MGIWQLRSHRARIGRIVQHRHDPADGGRRPAQIAEAVAPGQAEAARVERPQNLGGGAPLQKGGEDQVDPGLHLAVRVLGDYTARVAHQADR